MSVDVFGGAELALYARDPLGTSSLQDDVGGGCPRVSLEELPGAVFLYGRTLGPSTP
jgi:hypothetical protein